jgi:hypothetical protein
MILRRGQWQIFSYYHGFHFVSPMAITMSGLQPFDSGPKNEMSRSLDMTFNPLFDICNVELHIVGFLIRLVNIHLHPRHSLSKPQNDSAPGSMAILFFLPWVSLRFTHGYYYVRPSAF